MSTASAIRAYHGPALFSIGLRPFFLLSSLWAAVAVPVWIHAYASGGSPGLAWHVHEMLFGYAGGVIVGFLMTAVPNWTGRMPVVGLPLLGMVGLWLAGRIAMVLAAFSPAWTATPWPAAVDVLFLAMMAAMIWREVLVGQNWRNIPVALIISLLAVANVGFHIEVQQAGLAPTATRWALALVTLLIVLIGGRITPSFTRNWQLKRNGPLPAVPDRFDAAVLVLTGVALVGWSVAPQAGLVGGTLVAAGLVNLARLWRWKGWATTAEPLVLILHLGYLWVAMGLALVGASVIAPAHVPPSAGIHALTAGAIGVMTLAVMTRASRGHTGHSLTAGRAGVAIYLFVNLAAVVRVTGGLWPRAYEPLLITSAVLWSAAFLIFAFAYGPLLVRPRPAP
jgi:Uncharacterized protein involved in response to NO